MLFLNRSNAETHLFRCLQKAWTSGSDTLWDTAVHNMLKICHSQERVLLDTWVSSEEIDLSKVIAPSSIPKEIRHLFFADISRLTLPETYIQTQEYNRNCLNTWIDQDGTVIVVDEMFHEEVKDLLYIDDSTWIRYSINFEFWKRMARGVREKVTKQQSKVLYDLYEIVVPPNWSGF